MSEPSSATSEPEIKNAEDAMSQALFEVYFDSAERDNDGEEFAVKMLAVLRSHGWDVIRMTDSGSS